MLHVSLVCLPSARGPEAAPVRELVLDSAALNSGTGLNDALARSGAVAPFTVAGRPLEGLVPGMPPLVNGAVIVSGAPAPDPPRGGGPGLIFVVAAGPDAGQLISLSRGTYRIGRAAAGISIRDPLLSRRHAVLTVGSNVVRLRDENSVNGTWVDGRRITETTLTVSSTVRFGSSACRLALPAGARPAEVPLRRSLPEGHLPCGGTGPVPVDVPAPPPRSRALLLAAFLPLVLGVALALATGMVFFLAFAALSAVTASLPWLTGRHRTAAFDAAVAAAAVQDAARRRAAAPDPGRIALAAAGNPPPDSRGPCGPREVQVRIGAADQPANLAVRGTPPQWKPPILPDVPLVLPVAVPLDRPGGPPGAAHHPQPDPPGPPLDVTFTGSVEDVSGAARAVLLQLGRFAGDPLEVVCWGSPETLPPGARFLPGVSLASRRPVFEQLLRDSAAPVILDFGPEPAPVPPLHRVAILRFGSGLRDHRPLGTRVELEPGTAVLYRGGDALRFRPDLVGPRSFDRCARALGGMGPGFRARREGGIPRRHFLWSGEGQSGVPGEAATLSRWSAAALRPGLPAPLGASSSGALSFDLVSDGPHLLAAGTTGSGKSEFLRSFVLGVAAHHPPDKVNFLLIDFKGGSGLEALAQLPHAVGLLTDLSPESVSRALVSLRGELRRREALFAGHSVDSIEAFLLSAPAPAPPRLVVVIDEFRVLAEEVPDAVEHLMRIAALGRSLGVHLVLATQRPQGALTPDIRANITARAAFRVQSGLESLELIGTPAASDIPVRLPGRGFLKIGGGDAVEFQAASSSGGGPEEPGPVLQDLETFLRGPVTGTGDRAGKDAGGGIDRRPAGPAGKREEARGVEAAVRVLRAAAAGRCPAARSPVLPPLPEAIPPEPLLESLPECLAKHGRPRPSVPPSGAAIALGLLDLPAEQAQSPLLWSPQPDSHLALIGLASAGTAGALGHLVTECLLKMPDTHLYLLDGDFSLSFAAGAAQTGAYVQGHEAARAERVLERIAASVVDRLAGPADPAAPILLLISGWGRWAGALRSRRSSTGEDALQDIARDGAAAGVHLAVAGERELTGARFFPLVPNRVFLPLGASPEVLASWPRLPAIDPVPGRGFAQGRFAPGAVAQLVIRRRDAPPAPRPPGLRPFRVESLPDLVPPEALRRSPASAGSCRLPIGLGGDELETVFLELAPGTACAAVGPPRSGRTTFLTQLQRQYPPGLWTLRPPGRADQAQYWRATASSEPIASDPAHCLLLIDDADALPPDIHQLLGAAVSAGARAVLAAAPGFLLTQMPLARRARAADPGLVLAPRTPMDGEVFGVRLDVGSRGRVPGRAVLLRPGGQLELQLALASGPYSGRAATGPSDPPSP